jgi:hypothetical protein
VLRVALVCSVLTSLPLAAVAQSKSALSWVREPGAEGCIGTVELGQRVERLVGPMLVAAPEGQVSVEGKIAPAQRGFVAEITVSDAAGKVLGTRKLESAPDDCRAIDEKLAFVIAVAIDPNAALAELPGDLSQVEDPGAALLADLREQPPAPTPAPAPPPPAAKPASARAQPARAPSTPVQLRVALEPALGLGNLPSPAAGVLLGVGVAFGDLALWLRGAAWVPQEEIARGDAGVRMGGFGLALAVCPLGLRSDPWSAWLCAGAGADMVSAVPVGFDGTPKDRWIFGPDLELRAGWAAAASWWLGLSAGVQNRWPRQEFGYDVDGELQPVYRTPVASGRLCAVLELRF